MGSCIICGTSVDDGHVCRVHEEDVVFEFKGTDADQLTPNRYYRGTVDGFADFGIFVDIGDLVTGLLHRSELDQRLESIDLDAGDTLYVQVKGVRDNGNVDLGWSIRQDKTRFRGVLVDDPDAGEQRLPEAAEEDEGGSDVVRQQTSAAPTPSERSPDERRGQGTAGGGAETDAGDGAETDTSPAGDQADTADEWTQTPTDEDSVASTPEPTAATVSELDDFVGEPVRLEGAIDGIRQTGGPTIFDLRDETGTIECAAFEEAGVRAYPAVEVEDVVRIDGEVERRRGELQVETEALVVLEDDERAAVTERLDEALLQRARPDEFVPLAADETVAALEDEIIDAATAIRRAVIEGRPVVVRHAGTVDGYVAAAAIERATLPLVREHGGVDAEYHQFERRPLEGSVYDMDDATRDVTRMLSNRDRHDEPVPLFVFVAAGSPESVDGFGLLDIYGARRVLIDERPVDDDVREAADVVAAPSVPTTVTILAGSVAATIDPEVRMDLLHLPAVSTWDDPGETYTDLARESGYDDEDSRVLREALALGSYYQSYEDKRELVVDLLFGADVELAEQVSQQYRTRMDTAIETATANMDERTIEGETILVLDTEAYTHRREFPGTLLLLDELFRRHRGEATALLGVGRDECHVRSDLSLDIPAIVETAREDAPGAALDSRGARDGRIEFLAGEREAAREALIDALAGALSAPTQ